MPAFDPIFDLVVSLLAFGAIALTAFGIGRPWLRALKIAQSDPLDVAVWSISLGLVAAGLILLGLLRSGALYAPVVQVLSLLGGLWGLVELACAYLEWRSPKLVSADTAVDVSVGATNLPVGLFVALTLAALVLVGTFLVALAPPTSPEALSRSLELPKNLLLTPSSPVGELRSTPNLVQMWFLWALALDGPVAANLVAWGLGVLAALATIVLARPLLGAGSALLGGCLMLLCPGVVWQLSLPLEDLALALFTTLALSAAWQVLVQLESIRWAMLAGLMLGAAGATHFSGLLFAAALGAVWGYSSLANLESRRDLLRAGTVLGLTAIATLAPWLTVLWSEMGRQASQSLASALVHWGPMFLIAGPGLLVCRRLRGLNAMLCVLAVYGVLAVVIPGHARWWSPLVPAASMIAAWVWQELDRLPRLARCVVSASLFATAFAAPITCCQMAVRTWAVATGRQTRDEFLLAREPTYRAASLVNRICRPGDRLFCQDARTFYFACPASSWDIQLSSHKPSGGSLRPAVLPGSAFVEGSAYLLTAEAVEPARAACQQHISTLPAEAPRGGAAEKSTAFGEDVPILEYRFADDYNRQTRYRLYRLR